MRVAVVYDSGFGHTKKQAEAVSSGAAGVDGVTVTLFALADGEPDWMAIEAANAVIFGSPTYNGAISARFKGFMEASTREAWIAQKWRNKIAAGFTNSGSWHGDKLNSLVTLALFAAQHGMIWTGLDLFPGHSDDANNRIGGWLGAMAYSKDESPELSPVKSDLDTAAYLGARVAMVALQFKRGAE